MLVAFMLIQLVVNTALVAGVFRLLKQREAISGEARQREERLETLAAELCAFGRDVARQDTTFTASSPDSGASNRGFRASGVLPPAPPLQTPPVPENPDRFQGAETPLRPRVGLERVTTETPLLEGEIQVLRNLARGTQSNTAVRRVGRAGTGVRREAAGEGRRPARGPRRDAQPAGVTR